jgi:ABC-2 type transport system permease protein
MIQNAFANSSSSVLIGKVQGTIIDVLMPPLSSGELVLSYVAGAVTRGWLVGLAIFAAMQLWPGLHVMPVNLPAVLYFGTMGGVMLGLIGVLTGIWAEKFDHSAAVTNFIVQPLSLLSGTFYTTDRLHGIWHTLSAANPFHWVISGFRYGFVGRADVDVTQAALLLLAVNVVLWALCYQALRTGWRLKA